MKVIFLDFDGVLNSAEWIRNTTFSPEYRTASFMERAAAELNPDSVKLVGDLAAETGSSIVISSSWRLLHSLTELNDFLVSRGLDPTYKAIDMTPRSNKGFRGDEVQAWLNDTKHSIESYVIFDDDGDFYSGQPLVKTSWDSGLLASHVDLARKILNT